MLAGFKSYEALDSFDEIFSQVEFGEQNVFLTGKAGTGKSTFLMHLRKYTKKNYAVVASTGVAALHVRGQTIHSFFKFKPRLMDSGQVKAKKDRRLYQKLELLIIDEISMVRADLFDAIERFLCLNGPCPGKPFGGVKLCVIGDLFQLPPIVSPPEKALYFERYASPFFFSAPAFALANFLVIELEVVYRQRDPKWISLLNNIRLGMVNTAMLQELNQYTVLRGSDALLKEKDRSIVLTTTNMLADQINNQYLQQLPGRLYDYQGIAEGQFVQQDEKLPAPRILQLKYGARVMFTRNDSWQGGKAPRWVNGTIGTVTNLKETEIEVCVEENHIKKYYTVEKEKWESIEYHYDDIKQVIEEETVGTYCQYPLIHAWAVTIHKSQGKTLERIMLDLGRGAFAAGQLYVALSRCPSLECITLVHPVRRSDVRCDPAVLGFYAALKQSYMVEKEKTKEVV